MRIIIGGAGRVGTELARALRAEEMDVVLVDSDSRAVKNAQNLDVLVIHGDLTTREKLNEAGIGEAAIFVAATNSDERNLLALPVLLLNMHTISMQVQRLNHCYQYHASEI